MRRIFKTKLCKVTIPLDGDPIGLFRLEGQGYPLNFKFAMSRRELTTLRDTITRALDATERERGTR